MYYWAPCEISLARDLERIQAIVRTAARELVGADGATFVLPENGMCYYAAEDAIKPTFQGQRFPMEKCIGGWAMRRGEAAVIPDVNEDDRIPIEAYLPTYIKSLVMVPVRAAAPLASIGNYWARRHAPTQAEVNLLQTLADATAVAMENVTAYRELEHRVETRTRSLQQLMEDVESFSAFVSHDLRAPIRHIGAFASMLSSEHAAILPESARVLVHRISDSVKRMSSLIDALLELARCAQLQITKTRVDMRVLVEAEIAALRHEISSSVSFDIGDLPSCSAQPTLMRQVWSNLLSNAVKYSVGSDAPRIDIGGSRQGSEVIYCVRDNGIGFDSRNARELFSILHRFHAGSRFEGTGIGLAIAHKIVVRHGGRIWADSHPGAGATFYFALPVEESHEPVRTEVGSAFGG
jgi:signal transduction histidine kinase